MAGRPPKPTALKIAEGNRGKRPLGTKREPEPDVLTDLSAPEWLSATAKRVWDKQAPRMAKVRLLTVADTYNFAVWCQETGNYIDAQVQVNKLTEAMGGQSPLVVKGKDGKQPQPNPWLIVQSMAAKKCLALGREFGMTPVGRRQLAIEVQTDMFADLPSARDDEKPTSSYYN